MAVINSKKVHANSIHYESLKVFLHDVTTLVHAQHHSKQIKNNCISSFGSTINAEEELNNPQLANLFCPNGLSLDGYYSGSSSDPITRMNLHLQSKCSDIFGDLTYRAIQQAAGCEITFGEEVGEEEFNSVLARLGCQYNVNGGAANARSSLYLIVAYVNAEDVKVSCAACAYTPPTYRR